MMVAPSFAGLNKGIVANPDFSASVSICLGTSFWGSLKTFRSNEQMLQTLNPDIMLLMDIMFVHASEKSTVDNLPWIVGHKIVALFFQASFEGSKTPLF